MDSFRIVKNNDLSGPCCKIYSIAIDDETDTLFDQFLDQFYDDYPDEVQDIYDRISVAGKSLGMRPQFYKPNEGKPGDGICALYDRPDSKLRLYLIQYGTNLVVLGGGGPKPKSIQAWQESVELTKVVESLEKISNRITKAIIDKDIKITKEGFNGDLTMEII